MFTWKLIANFLCSHDAHEYNFGNSIYVGISMSSTQSPSATQMFWTSVACVFSSNVSTRTNWISRDLILSSDYLLMMLPSNGSVNWQLVEKMSPSKRNFGIFPVVDVSRLSCEITKFLGTSLRPDSSLTPRPGQIASKF